MIDVSTKKLRAKFYTSKVWRDKRREILIRDMFECLDCKEEGKVTTATVATLEIDHVKELKDYPELALDNDNLRTLCNKHHNKKHKRFEFRPSRGKRWNDEWWG